MSRNPEIKHIRYENKQTNNKEKTVLRAEKISTILNTLKEMLRRYAARDFSGGPVVKNPRSNAGDTGSIPGQGTKIPHAVGQLSQRLNKRPRVPQTKEPTHSAAHVPQLQSSCALEPALHN